jgi:hypothetical protein
MVSSTNKEICSFLFRGVIPIQKPEEVKQAKEEQTDMKKLKTSRTDDTGSSSSQQNADGKPAEKDPKEKFSNKIREQLMKKK